MKGRVMHRNKMFDAHDQMRNSKDTGHRWEVAKQILAQSGAGWVTTGTAPRQLPQMAPI
ncbi:MAG: hypothetical protein ACK4L4_05020 [Gemmobacter sp.]